MQESCSCFEVVGLAKAMVLAVLGQEGEPVWNDHTRAEMVEQVFGCEGSLRAVALKKLVGQKCRKVCILLAYSNDQLRTFIREAVASPLKKPPFTNLCSFWLLQICYNAKTETKWAPPVIFSNGLFFLIFVFSIQLTVNVQYKFLPMTGFEPRTFEIGSNRSTNCATPLPRSTCYYRTHNFPPFISGRYWPDLFKYKYPTLIKTIFSHLEYSNFSLLLIYHWKNWPS